MSDIKRYSVGRSSVVNVDIRENGEFVLYSDHIAAMEALKSVPSQDHEARIKALERSRFLLDGCIEIGKKHERRIEELEEGNAILDKEHVKYMRRTEALEKALNEHMVKERDGRTVELSDLDLLRIIIQRKTAFMKVQKYEQASLFRDVERMLIKACGIPEGAIEGMSPNPSKEP